MKICLLPLVVLSILFGSTPSAAAPAYPKPAQVLATLGGGPDSDDTYARRLAALQLWQDAVKVLEGNPQRASHDNMDGLSPQALAMFRSYSKAWQAVYPQLPKRYSDPCVTGVKGAQQTCHRAALENAKQRLLSDSAFRQQVLGQHLGPNDMQRYLSGLQSRADERDAWMQAKAAERGNVTWNETRLFTALGLQKMFPGLSEPFRAMAVLAALSIVWLLPAGLLWIGIRSDRDEKRQVHGTGWHDGKLIDLSFSVPTGQIIRGDPKAAGVAFYFWTLIVPVASLYVPLFALGERSTLIWRIGIPLVIVILIFCASTWLEHSRAGSAAVARKAWLAVLAAAALNLLAWLAYSAVRFIG